MQSNKLEDLLAAEKCKNTPEVLLVEEENLDTNKKIVESKLIAGIVKENCGLDSFDDCECGGYYFCKCSTKEPLTKERFLLAESLLKAWTREDSKLEGSSFSGMCPAIKKITEVEAKWKLE